MLRLLMSGVHICMCLKPYTKATHPVNSFQKFSRIVISPLNHEIAKGSNLLQFTLVYLNLSPCVLFSIFKTVQQISVNILFYTISKHQILKCKTEEKNV